MEDVVSLGSRARNEIEMTGDEIQQLLIEAENRLRVSTSNEGSKSQTLKGNESQNASLTVPKLSSSQSLQPYVREQGNVVKADALRIVDPQQKAISNLNPTEARTSNTPLAKVKAAAGDAWFNLPQSEVTPELKRDLQLLRMRSVLDPKRHYKKENGKANLPPFSQVGTIIEGPTEFFSARIAKKDRKKTFVGEALALERETKRFGSKYSAIQSTKQNGKKSFYKGLQSKRGHKNK